MDIISERAMLLVIIIKASISHQDLVDRKECTTGQTMQYLLRALYSRCQPGISCTPRSRL